MGGPNSPVVLALGVIQYAPNNLTRRIAEVDSDVPHVAIAVRISLDLDPGPEWDFVGHPSELAVDSEWPLGGRKTSRS